MRHPSETELALFAGGDLNVIRRFQVGRHIRDCARCSRETGAFASVRRELVNEAAQLPAHLKLEPAFRGHVRQHSRRLKPVSALLPGWRPRRNGLDGVRWRLRRVCPDSWLRPGTLNVPGKENGTGHASKRGGNAHHSCRNRVE